MTAISSELIRASLHFVSAADMLGTQYEFMDREEVAELEIAPKGFFGPHQQPLGAFSDDTSLTMCLAESLCGGFDLRDMAERFCKWLYSSYWTSHGVVFDAGNQTRIAIAHLSFLLKEGKNIEQCILAMKADAYSCGNGSLMRVLPLLFYIKDKPVEERFRLTKLVSSLTHPHTRCVIACFYYLEFCRQLLTTLDKRAAYERANRLVSDFLRDSDVNPDEIGMFERVLSGSIPDLRVNQIFSTGYVIDTLEASIWSFMTTDSYKNACVTAIRLGFDTDTTAMVAAGLSAMHEKSVGAVPASWLACLAKRVDIEDLAQRLFKSLT